MTQGRKPTATAEKKLYGNPGKRALNNAEPEPDKLTELPEPPEWLGEHGREAWERNGPILLGMTLLTTADLDLFATLCQNIDIMINSSLDVKKNGYTVMGQRGWTRNPALASFAAASSAIKSLASEFGMTPSSRAKIKLPEDDDGWSIDNLGDADNKEEPS